MNRHIILSFIAIHVFLSLQLYSQGIPVTNFQFETKRIENRILRNFRRLDCYNKTKDYSVFFIYMVRLKNVSREFLTEEFFPKKLEIVNRGIIGNRPVFEALIYDDSLNIIARTWNLPQTRVICLYNDFFNKLLLRYAITNKVDFLFVNSGNLLIYFSVKGNMINVIRLESKGIEVYTLKDFLECCWYELDYTLYLEYRN